MSKSDESSVSAVSWLELDGWEYWNMGEPIPETTVINRALVAQRGATGEG
jgi:hypothetical protein